MCDDEVLDDELLHAHIDRDEAREEVQRLQAKNEELRNFLAWIETWVSTPETAYSVAALEELFAQTRQRIRSLAQ